MGEGTNKDKVRERLNININNRFRDRSIQSRSSWVSLSSPSREDSKSVKIVELRLAPASIINLYIVLGSHKSPPPRGKEENPTLGVEGWKGPIHTPKVLFAFLDAPDEKVDLSNSPGRNQIC